MRAADKIILAITFFLAEADRSTIIRAFRSLTQMQSTHWHLDPTDSAFAPAPGRVHDPTGALADLPCNRPPLNTTKSCVRSLELAAAAPVFVVLAVVVLAAQVTELGLPVTAQAASALRIGQQRRSCAEYIPPCNLFYDLSIL